MMFLLLDFFVPARVTSGVYLNYISKKERINKSRYHLQKGEFTCSISQRVKLAIFLKSLLECFNLSEDKVRSVKAKLMSFIIYPEVFSKSNSERFLG